MNHLPEVEVPMLHTHMSTCLAILYILYYENRSWYENSTFYQHFTTRPTAHKYMPEENSLDNLHTRLQVVALKWQTLETGYGYGIMSHLWHSQDVFSGTNIGYINSFGKKRLEKLVGNM